MLHVGGRQQYGGNNMRHHAFRNSKSQQHHHHDETTRHTSSTYGISKDPNMAWKPPSQQAKWADPDFQISQLPKATTPTRLRGRERNLVTVFDISFVDFHKIYRVPIKILDDIRID